GTGDRAIDKSINTAKALVTSGRTIQRACRNSDLAALGFPGSCPDPTGGTFTVADLQACLLTEGETAVDKLIALVFAQGAPGATPTPTATAVATATGAPGATATTTAATTPGATSTGGPTSTGAAPSSTAAAPTSTAAAPTSTAAAPTPTAGGPTPTAGGPTPTAGAPTATAGVPTVTEVPTPQPTSTTVGGACPTQITFLANGEAS
ncbi:MAG: hypothetical protein E6J90_53590, partial [Deltaproteobacteria bacterium]